ncbi:MAG TPA: sialidase family protein [Planctomycetota bacterium]|nr:sialidase family protein [Planctomycetota bacterium]
MIAPLLLAAWLGTQDGVTKIPLLPPGPDNPRNSEGDFIPLRDGRLLFVYTRFTGESGSDHAPAHLASRVSSDGGRTWSERDEVVVPREGDMNVMSVSLLRLSKSGDIALVYLRKDSLQKCVALMRRSADDGRTWSEPVPCMPGQEGYFVVNNDRLVQLSSGRLVLPASRRSGDDQKPAPGRARCFLSDDEGRTWRSGTTELPAPEKSRSGLQEPLVVELGDGRLLMLCRTDRGRQYRSFSADGGDTWSAAEPSELVSPLSPASLERIPSTGDLLLVWNDHAGIDDARRGKRTPLCTAVSKDDGRTWTSVKVLEQDPEGWYCYTAIEFVGRRVLLAYCAGDPKVGRLNRTQITSFDVDWLYR